MDGRIAPIVLAHLTTIGLEPQHVFYSCTFDGTALEKMPAAEYGVPSTKIDHALDERQQVAVLGLNVPVDPTCGIVLAVGIVVSALSVSDRVSGVNHRHALGEQ